MREQGKYRGVGLSTYVEVCGLAPSRAVGPQGVGLQAAFWESAVVRVHPSGSATVFSGASPHGQGLDTSFAQIAGDILGIDPQNVDVLHGDTDQGTWGWDTYGSRSLAVGGEAIVRAAQKVQDKAKRICAALLEAAPEESSWSTATRVRGSPETPMTMPRSPAALHSAQRAARRLDRDGRDSFYDRRTSSSRWRARVHRRLDVQSGKVEVALWLAGDDCGPASTELIDGQGTAAHARVGQACSSRSSTTRTASSSRNVRRLRAAHRGGAAVVRDRPHGDAVARQPARRQGRRRGGTIPDARGWHRRDRRLRPRGVSYSTCVTPMRVWETIQRRRARDPPAVTSSAPSRRSRSRFGRRRPRSV